MSISLGDAIVRILVDSAELVKGLDAAAAKVHKQGQAMTKVGKGMTVGLTLPIVGVGVAALKTAADFDQSMRNMNAIAQMSEKQFVEMKNKVIDFSMTTRATSTQVADALTTIVASGYEADDAFTMLKASSSAAGASMATVDETTSALISTLASYNYAAGDSAMIMDKFLRIVTLGPMTLSDLSNSIGTVIPVAASMNVSLDEVGAAMATLTKAGLNTATSATYLRAVFTSLIKPTDEVTELVQEYGYESAAALLKAEGLAGALEFLQEATGGETDKLAELLPNIRAIQGATVLLKDESITYMDALEKMADSEGAVNRAREEQYKALSTQLKRLKGAIEVILITIGDEFVPTLAELTDKLTDVARGFRDISPTKLKLGMAFAALVAAIGPLIWALGTLITSFVTVKAAILGVSLSTGVLGAAISLLTGPIGLLLALLGFLGFAYIRNKKYLEAMSKQYLETVDSEQEYVDAMLVEMGLTDEIVDHQKPWRDQIREIKKEREADTLALEYRNAELKRTRDAEIAAEQSMWDALEAIDMTTVGTQRLTDALEEEEAVLEDLSLGIQDMEVAWFSNISSIRDNVRAYEELRDKVISAGRSTADTTHRFQTSMARSEEDMLLKREDLLKKHAEKRAWIETGDWERSQQEQAEAHGYWETIMAEELAEFDANYELKKSRRTEDYEHQIATANAAAGEKARIVEEQRQAELAAMREAQTERILMAALEAMETKGWLTIPWIEGTVSAQDYFDAVQTGLIPISADIEDKLGGAIAWIRDLAGEADAQQASGYETLSKLVDEYYGDVMSLEEPLAVIAESTGAITEGVTELGEESERRVGDIGFTMYQDMIPALGDTESKVDDLRREFNEFGRDAEDAAEDVQREVRQIKPELRRVDTEVGFLESSWRNSLDAMVRDVKDLIEEIQNLIDELKKIPRRIVITIVYREENKPTGFTEAQHGFHGIVSGPLPLLVGEAGPEEVHVTPLRGQRRGGDLAPTGEGGGLTIILEQPVFYGVDDFEEAVRDILDEEAEGARGFRTGGRG